MDRLLEGLRKRSDDALNRMRRIDLDFDAWIRYKQAEEERNYKMAASAKCRELLAGPDFTKLLENEDWRELHERVQKVVSKR